MTVIDNLLEAQYEQVWELKTPEDWVMEITPGDRTDSHRKYQRKSPCALTGGAKKEPFWNTPEHSVLNKACPQEKLVKHSLTYWDITRAELNYGEVSTQLQPILAILSHRSMENKQCRGPQFRDAKESGKCWTLCSWWILCDCWTLCNLKLGWLPRKQECCSKTKVMTPGRRLMKV